MTTLRTVEGDDSQVQSVVSLLHRILVSNLVGVYLYGSGVQPGLGPWSDIDILAVTERTLTDGDRSLLVEGMLHISVPVRSGSTRRPLELAVVDKRTIKPWRYPPQLEFLFGEWLREAFESFGPPQYPCARPDLTTVLAMAAEMNRCFMGPPLGRVIGRIPDRDLLRSLLEGIPGLLDNLAWDPANVLLTLARIWFTLETNRFCPKDDAGRWVQLRLTRTQRQIVEEAIRWYWGEPAEMAAVEESDLRACADHMAAQAVELGRGRCPELA